MTKKAILVVSFGTSYHDTRKVTIYAIKEDIKKAYPDHTIYRAWTSKIILNKLKQRDQIHYDTVTEAFERMKRDGITDVIVQPTHVINGIENELMIQDSLAYSSDFSTIQSAHLCNNSFVSGEYFPSLTTNFCKSCL